MDYSSVIAGYKSLAMLLVGAKNTPDSIEPIDAADIGIELADLLLPILNKINGFGISGGATAPVSGSGSEDDLYIQGGAKLVFWRKKGLLWIKQTEVDLGIQIIDGNISLQSSVLDFLVTVSPGNWGIDNVIYSTAIQTQFNLAPADLNYNRIDLIYADTNSAISLLQGVANSNPVAPEKPNNTILVSYVYVPSQASGNLPYIADRNTPIVIIPTVPPLADGVIIPGDFVIDGAYVAVFSSPFTYRLNTIDFTPIESTLQLSAPDATYTRIDLIVGDTNNHYIKVDGIAGSTYNPPNVPPNTIVLAQIYRYANGANVIIINDKTGYVNKGGDTMFGRLNIANGNDIVLKAPLGPILPGGLGSDTGDLVGQRADGSEAWRLFFNHVSGEMCIKYDGSNDFKVIATIEDLENSLSVKADKTDLEAEELSRTIADEALTASINSEISRAISQDNILQDSLNSLEESIVEHAIVGYTDLESDHKTYNNPLLKDRDFSLFKDSLGNYLSDTVDYAVLPSGGFALTDELFNGDVLRVSGTIVLRTLKPITTTLNGGIDGFGQHNSSFSSAETLNRLISNQQFFANKGTLSQFKCYATKAGLVPFDLWKSNGDGTYSLYWQKQLTVVLGENTFTAGTDFEINVEVYKGGLLSFYQNTSTLGNIGWKNMPVASSFILGTSNLLPGSISTPITSVRQYALEVSYEAEHLDTRFTKLEAPKKISSLLGVVELINLFNYSDPDVMLGYALNASHVPVEALDYAISGFIDISGIPDNTEIIVSDGGIPNLAYFYTASQAYHSRILGSGGTEPLAFNKPTGAALMKLNINPSHVALDAYMVLAGNYMPSTYIAWEAIPTNPEIDIPRFTRASGGSTAKKTLNGQYVAIGHSMVKQDQTTQDGELIKGLQQYILEKIDFTGGYYNGGFSGHALSSPPASGQENLSIVRRLGEYPVNSFHKYYTILALTNDFRLNCYLGSMSDFINNTGDMTVYGAFRILYDYMYSQDPQAQIIFITDPHRNNSGYSSYFQNARGLTLVDYINAGLDISKRMATPEADVFGRSMINETNLSEYTWDDLHLRNIGYKRASTVLMPVVLNTFI